MRPAYTISPNLLNQLERKERYAAVIASRNRHAIDAFFLMETAREMLMNESATGHLLHAALRSEIRLSKSAKAKTPPRQDQNDRSKKPITPQDRVRDLSLLLSTNPSPGPELDSALSWLIDQAAYRLRKNSVKTTSISDSVASNAPSEENDLVSEIRDLSHNDKLLNHPIKIRESLQIMPSSAKCWILAAAVRKKAITRKEALRMAPDVSPQEFDLHLDSCSSMNEKERARARQRVHRARGVFRDVLEKLGYALVLALIIIGIFKVVVCQPSGAKERPVDTLAAKQCMVDPHYMLFRQLASNQTLPELHAAKQCYRGTDGLKERAVAYA